MTTMEEKLVLMWEGKRHEFDMSKEADIRLFKKISTILYSKNHQRGTPKLKAGR